MSSYRRSNQSTSSSIPRFVENLRDVLIREGETGSLECRVVGFPRPEVQWERNGRMVAKSRNIQLERIGDRCLLRIKSCQSKDEGHYNCIASNIMGTATSRGTLHVLSGFKKNTRCYNGRKDITSSEMGNSSEKKVLALVTNSKHATTFQTPHSTKSKLDPVRALKPEDTIAENSMRVGILVRKNVAPKYQNMTTNKLNSSQKVNCFTPGNLSHNYIREMPQKMITKSNINKRNKDIATSNQSRCRETLRTPQSTQPKSLSTLKIVNACKNDGRSVLSKDLNGTSDLRRSSTVKERPKFIDGGAQRMATGNKNKEIPKVKKVFEKKEVVRNKSIVRGKNLTDASHINNGTQLKRGPYQKSAVWTNDSRKTAKLLRQKKFEDKVSVEEQPILRTGKSAAPTRSTKSGNEIKALKVSDISKKAAVTNSSPIVSTMTNYSTERNKKSYSGFKIKSSKKIEDENNLWKSKTGRSSFESVKNTAVQCEKGGKTDSKSFEPSKSISLDIFNISNRNLPLEKSNFVSSSRISCHQSSKVRSNKLNNRNINDSRTNMKQQINHTTTNKVNDFKEISKLCKNHQCDSTAHRFLKKEASYMDPTDVKNESEQFSDTTQDYSLNPCAHKSFDTILNYENEDSNANSKIRSSDVQCKFDKLSYMILPNDIGDKFVGSNITFGETQESRSSNTNESNWKQNNEHRNTSSSLTDINNLNKNGTSFPCAQVPSNSLLSDIGQESKNEDNAEIYDVSQTKSSDSKMLQTTKVPISPRTSADGPGFSDDVFRDENFCKLGKKEVEYPKKDLREREENGTLAKINGTVASANCLISRIKEDKTSPTTGTKTSDGCTERNEKVINHIRAYGRKKRELPDTITCRGNVRLNSDVIEEECEYFIPKVPEVEALEDTQQVESQEDFPVRIVKGPQSVTVLRGESVTLAAHFQGTPQPTVTWARGGTTLRSDGRVSILVGRDMSVLTISDVTADDSGKYVVTVENSGGGDSCFASMAVVDLKNPNMDERLEQCCYPVFDEGGLLSCWHPQLTEEYVWRICSRLQQTTGIPEPPGGQPTASDITDHSLVLSWYGSMYDGGSVVTGYVIEMCTLPERRWHKVSSCVNTSHVIQGLSNGQQYVFRVRAENRYGLSQPSRESEAIFLEDSSSCEDWEVSRSPVKVEAGSLFSEQFELKEEVGKGRFGIVHRCIERTSGRPRAAKIIRCIKAKDKETVQREISVMNRLHHPKLMQILAAFESGKNMIMVMEFISGGELFERVIADDFVLTEHDCILFMRQICDGVAYMHKCSVLHLDLKPENILCKTRTCHQIKIIDFGLARVYNPDENLRVLFGTPEFVAPEVINYEPVGPPSDMWSVGVICYVLLSGLSPFMGESDPETFANITRGEMDFDDEAFDTISEDAKNFISLLLVKKQKDRMTAEECLKHCWLASPGWNTSDVPLSTEKLKRFIVRRKWQKTGTAIRALGRMVSLSRSSLGSSSGMPSPLGSPKVFRSQSEISRSETSESGFSEVFSDTNSVSELIS